MQTNMEVPATIGPMGNYDDWEDISSDVSLTNITSVSYAKKKDHLVVFSIVTKSLSVSSGTLQVVIDAFSTNKPIANTAVSACRGAANKSDLSVNIPASDAMVLTTGSIAVRPASTLSGSFIISGTFYTDA